MQEIKKIRIKRPKEKINRNCSYEIFINDRVITTLKSGEDKVIEIVGLNSDTLQAKIQWCGSNKIKTNTLKNNESVEVRGNVIFNRYLLIFCSIIPIIGILISQNREMKILGTILIVTVLILIIGTLTIWRNKWIDLKR